MTFLVSGPTTHPLYVALALAWVSGSSHGGAILAAVITTLGAIIVAIITRRSGGK